MNNLIALVLISTLCIDSAKSNLSDDCASSSKTYHVATSCTRNDSSCHTLKYYMRKPSAFFSCSTIKFDSGIHNPLPRTSLKVENVSRVTFSGQNATISCSENYFTFLSVEKLQLKELQFLNCGLARSNTIGNAGINVTNGRDLQLENIFLSNSIFQGLLIENVLGNTSITSSCIQNYLPHRFFFNKSATAVYYTHCPSRSFFHVSETMFEGNVNIGYKNNSLFDHTSLSMPFAGGLTILIKCSNVLVFLNNTNFKNNSGGNGGNLAMIVYNTTQITLNNSVITGGQASEGGGLFLHVKLPNQLNSTSYNNSEHVKIENTSFKHNTARYSGGAIAIYQKESIQTDTAAVSCITISHSQFHYNSLQKGGGGATAINSVTYKIPEIFSHFYTQFKIFVNNSLFRNNSVCPNDWNSSGSAVIFVKSSRFFSLTSVTVDLNNSTAILGTETNFIFGGSVTLSNNNAESGGGLLLCQNAVMFLENGLNLTIINNTAEHTGGGISVESTCLISKPICFFQFASLNTQHKNNARIRLYNNTAKHAGHNLYGGSVEYCYMINGSESLNVFNEVFRVHPRGEGQPYITSSPTHVCLCENNTVNCNLTHPESLITPKFPGESITFKAVLVGQLNGSVPGLIQLQLESQMSSSFIASINDTTCSNVSYVLNSNRISKKDKLWIEVAQQGDTSVTDHLKQYRRVYMTIPIKNCPKGFKLIGSNKVPYTCACDDTLASLAHLNVSCDIKQQIIVSPRPLWIGYVDSNHSFIHYETIIVQKECPYDYCHPYVHKCIAVDEQSFHQDVQCNHRRSGIMCGKCADGLSLKMGSSRCGECSNVSLLHLIVFAFLGIALVFVLTVLNMTVAEGTLNGIIFYANIVLVQRSVFSSYGGHTFVAYGFIAWLNLDYGISACLFKGMDEFSKMVLQFVFPVYIWIILGAIVFFSRRWNIVTRLVGRNAVKIFATLIILSFSKLLRAIIAGMSFSYLKTANETYIVWTVDGNIPFLHGKHIALFTLSLLFSIISLPFIFSLLFIQVLNKYSHCKIFFFVRKFKPLFDAYTGPYSDGGRFWTGLLLFMRLILFIISALNLNESGPDLKNCATIVAVILLLLVAWLIRPGIYKRKCLDVLECLSLVNLGLLSICTMYARHNNSSQSKFTISSVAITFIMFVGIIIYHTSKRLYSINCVKIQIGKVKRLFSCLSKREEVTPSINTLAQNIPPYVRFDLDREPLLAEDDD